MAEYMSLIILWLVIPSLYIQTKRDHSLRKLQQRHAIFPHSQDGPRRPCRSNLTYYSPPRPYRRSHNRTQAKNSGEFRRYAKFILRHVSVRVVVDRLWNARVKAVKEQKKVEEEVRLLTVRSTKHYMQ
ncbi:hypothetical protein BC936DRAFT_142793 [Jimgerdemannia flammicorona]|uniref:Uncharacterized protein n=1 Tax=Jimgerdemannia flammicorona TaxID=994334 RepID=A0A433DER5_9FUNG|nr:hypothetical protein BC936DRAFT_142793 [Jimgerdemannia flammicorona]